MVIYTRPKVQALQKAIPTMNKFVSFIVIILRGGETPNLIDLADQGNNHMQQPQPAYDPGLAKVFAMLHGVDEDYNLDAEIAKAMRDMARNCSKLDMSFSQRYLHEVERG